LRVGGGEKLCGASILIFESPENGIDYLTGFINDFFHEENFFGVAGDNVHIFYIGGKVGFHHSELLLL
jgi:hypothetical protein